MGNFKVTKPRRLLCFAKDEAFLLKLQATLHASGFKVQILKEENPAFSRCLFMKGQDEGHFT